MKKLSKICAGITVVLVAIVLFLSLLSSCSIGDSDKKIYREGYDDGYMEGYTIGQETGLDDGYGKGYSEGRSEGFEKGWDSGLETAKENAAFDHEYDDGYDDGYSAGYKNGYSEGYDLGEIHGEESVINSLYWDENGDLIKGTDAIRSEVLKEVDARIAQMRIPNPVNPGHDFQGIEDLEDYARQLHEADVRKKGYS